MGGLRVMTDQKSGATAEQELPKTFVAVSYRLEGDGDETAFWNYEVAVGNAWDKHAQDHGQLRDGTTGGDFPSRRLTLEVVCTASSPDAAREIVTKEAACVLQTVEPGPGFVAPTEPTRVDDEPETPPDRFRWRF